jgi:peroxiredoxin
MVPQLVSWHEKWSEQGLVIIEIDNGDFDSLDAVEKHVADGQIPFTVLHDKGGIVCERYSVIGYPSAYLLDKTGTVIWEGHPADLSADATRIEAALS